jgi:AcrR family transcriptional regulator
VSPADDRERIRQALIDLCFERGFAQLTEDALCERAGIGRAEFERHYTDLEDCFFQVYQGELRRFQALTADARDGLSNWRERVRATAYALLAFLSEDERVTNLVAVEVRSGGERVRILFEAEVEALIDLIDEGRRDPAAPASLTRATAESVGGGIFNQIYTVAGPAGPASPEPGLIPQMMYVVVLPYVGAEAAAEELEIPPPPDHD